MPTTYDETVFSLLGAPLAAPALPPAERAAAEARLAQAQNDVERDPSLENTIWYGRRAAYLYQFQRAIAIYSAGIARFPEAYQLYRHRGHRLISTRRFTAAIADFEHAAALAEGKPVEVEPDGIPNQLNRPLSNSHFNIWYHLGLAYYLSGAFDQAIAAYRRCLEFCDNDDSTVATIDWLYMSYRRNGRHAAAAELLTRITPDMEIIEDQAYHKRLLMYKGLLTPNDLMPAATDADTDELTIVTQGYGVGNWHLYHGATGAALAIFQRILYSSSWSAFGYIAAEVEVANVTSPAAGTD